MPSIDKKMITALGDFLFRISNFHFLKDQLKNKKNWDMILE
jgi:hypothetical protein